MRRREFLGVLGAAAWPLTARAQQRTMPVIGFLNSGAQSTFDHFADAFRRGLGDQGFVAGQNVAITYRWADGRYERLPGFAAELVQRKVNVIVATGAAPAAMAAKAATATIPIVFVSSNSVRLGLVASLNRPGGNLTGTSLLTDETELKRFALLAELVPGAKIIGALVNQNSPKKAERLPGLLDAAKKLGRQLHIAHAAVESELDAAFERLIKARIGGLFVASDPFFLSSRKRIVALAARHRFAAAYERRDFVADGGLMSYSPDLIETYRHIGVYAGRVLKGERPSDLPVTQPTKFELALNLRTAKAYGITIPATLLALADEVIE